MRDFVRFLWHLGRIVYFIRGVLLALALILIIFAIILSRVEDLTFGDAVYLVLITALTVGYGDISPVTVAGRVVSIATGFVGMLTTGVVVAAAVRALTVALQEHHSRKPSNDEKGSHT